MRGRLFNSFTHHQLRVLNCSCRAQWAWSSACCLSSPLLNGASSVQKEIETTPDGSPSGVPLYKFAYQLFDFAYTTCLNLRYKNTTSDDYVGYFCEFGDVLF